MSGMELRNKASIGYQKHHYDINTYNFIGIFQRLFECNDLATLHKKYGNDYQTLSLETDQFTSYHKRFYDHVAKNVDFIDTYKRFLKEIIHTHFSSPLIYQVIPTFRIHLPKNIAVAEWHCDAEYSHETTEINVYLPLTTSVGNRTIWTESMEGKKDYQPLDAQIGDYYLWRGSTLIHGNKINDTDQSRISIDFRIMLLSDYKETDKLTTSAKVPMKLGEYWKVL